jgi:ankyrin repeat protein
MIISDFFNQINPLAFVNTSSSSVAELQKAIIDSDLTALERLISTHPSLLSQQMPNGELPLNFAVKQKNESIVKKFLEFGADPSLKDDQYLNAMDFAILDKEEKIAAQIFHHYISKDVQDTLSCFQNTEIKKEMNAAVWKIYNATNYIALEKMNPLQRAILQKDKEKVKSLLDNKTEASLLTDNGDSILHLAAAAGDKEIFNLCLPHLNSKKIDLKNSQGFTPLHYAASQGHLDIMQMLAKEGANIRLTDNHQLTPLMLLCENIDLRDPLRVDRLDKFVFLATLAMWSSQFVTFQTMDWRVAIAIHITTLSWSTLATLTRNMQMEFLQTRKEMISRLILSVIIGGISESFFRTSNVFGTIISAYNASGFAKRAFNGLSNCWRNSYRGRTRAIFKAFIAHAPETKIAYDYSSVLFGKLSAEFANAYGLYNKIFLCKMVHPFTCMDRLSEMSQLCAIDKESTACQDAWDAYAKFITRGNQLKDSFKMCESVIPSVKENCDNAASNYRNMCYKNPESSDCDAAESLLNKIINSASLDQCKNAIEKITGNVNSTFKQIKTAFKKIGLTEHPDKGGTSEKFIPIKEAYEIAKKCFENTEIKITPSPMPLYIKSGL